MTDTGLERIIESSKLGCENKAENSLRPRNLNDFIGQEKLKNNLKIFIKAAKRRFETLDHCLFYAPPGLGKTTLAHIIAKEMDSNLRVTSGPVLEKIKDLAAILTNLSDGDVLFIDEIHRINHFVEEALYPVMEDFELDIIIGQGPSAKTIKLPIPRFTLIGATTKAGLLSSPLRDRFGIIERLEFYEIKDLMNIVNRSATIMNIQIDKDAINEIAIRSRGTPRIVNRLLKRVRDFAEIKGDKISGITYIIAKEALSALEVDSAGLDKIDRSIIIALITKFDGGPAGIETIAVAISEDVNTIADIYEPYLIQSGFIARTSRGRIVTEAGYNHIGITPPIKTIKKKLQDKLL
ncbi:MAG: Holliday junction branch migration DNA helicase RuvB [Endomicrobium sp.]|jgi:Holliday junction DNA helicase RuvB|nr:Holliday junction branch migration DNA helicase RuvB [Endomicrobium sp.]